MTLSKVYNKYDCFIIFLISSLVLGNIGGSFQLIRIISFLFLPFVIKKKYSSIWKKCTTFFLLWFIYASISLIWTKDYAQGLKELFYFVPHMGSFFLIPYLGNRANKPMSSLLLGWLVYLILASPFAFYEIFTDQHFGNLEAKEQNYGAGIVEIKKYSALFYANYNTFVLYLCYAMPFLFSYLLYEKKRNLQVLGWIGIAILVFILLINASRGGLLVFGITICVFPFYYRKIEFKNKNIIVSIIFIVLLYVVIENSEIIFSQFLNRFVLSDNVSFSSDNSRMELFNIGINLWYNSYGFGTGIGSMIPCMASMSKSGILANHNLFIEILMQYCTIIFLLFLSHFLFLLKRIRQKKTFSPSHFILVTSLLTIPILSIINSIYLVIPSTWIYFSSLLYIAERFDNKNS